MKWFNWPWDVPQVPTITSTGTPPPVSDEMRGFTEALDRYDANHFEPRDWSLSADYGRDILVDLNRLAHYRGTGIIHRDCMQRAFKEITRLRRRLDGAGQSSQVRE